MYDNYFKVVYSSKVVLNNQNINFNRIKLRTIKINKNEVNSRFERHGRWSQKFGCWKRSGHGNVDLVRSLRESCDVYFYELALETGIERISEMARRLGIGERHDIPMSAVAEGLAPTKEWKNRVKGEDWVIGDSVNASIGQGQGFLKHRRVGDVDPATVTDVNLGP